MTVIDILEECYEELATRESNGITVSLVWRRGDDSVKVVVVDARSEEQFEIAVGDASPLDVFHHPFAYAARRPTSCVAEQLVRATG